MTISELRKQIDKLDQEILEALSARLKIARQIGIAKRKADQPLLDLNRKKGLLSDRRAQAKKLDLSPEFIEKLFEMIHNYSLEGERKT